MLCRSLCIVEYTHILIRFFIIVRRIPHPSDVFLTLSDAWVTLCCGSLDQQTKKLICRLQEELLI